jgi:hypothetical protein
MVTLFSLLLNGDIVLGIQWLEKLQPVICDSGRMSMEFRWGDRAYEIVAQPIGTGQVISNAMMGQEINGGGKIFAVKVRPAQCDEAQPIHAGILRVLQDFQLVLKEPNTIPLACEK